MFTQADRINALEKQANAWELEKRAILGELATLIGLGTTTYAGTKAYMHYRNMRDRLAKLDKRVSNILVPEELKPQTPPPSPIPKVEEIPAPRPSAIPDVAEVSGSIKPTQKPSLPRAVSEASPSWWSRHGTKVKWGAGAAAAGYLGHKAYKYYKNRPQEKVSSLDPSIKYLVDLDLTSFIKQANFRAAEILLANGIDPETFRTCEPEHVKLASFPIPGDAATHHGDFILRQCNSQLDQAAVEIISEVG